MSGLWCYQRVALSITTSEWPVMLSSNEWLVMFSITEWPAMLDQHYDTNITNTWTQLNLQRIFWWNKMPYHNVRPIWRQELAKFYCRITKNNNQETQLLHLSRVTFDSYFTENTSNSTRTLLLEKKNIDIEC